MEEKINLVEILKDCPEGMELDCTMYDNVSFVGVVDNDKYPIVIKTKSGFITKLTKYGHNIIMDDGKCVIFPKGKTTWKGFQRPFKDGDIVYTDFGSIAILKITSNLYYSSYCGLFSNLFKTNITLSPVRFATEEEKQKLFDAIKIHGYKWNEKTKTLEKLIEPKFKDGDVCITKNGIIFIYEKKIMCNNHCGSYISLDQYNQFIPYYVSYPEDSCYLAREEEKKKLFESIKANGYKWDEKTKTLEKLIEPKFKIGDRIKHKTNTRWVCTIARVADSYYFVDGHPTCYTVKFSEHNEYELIPNKLDINTLKPFDKVLVRQSVIGKWGIEFFGGYSEGFYYTTGNCMYAQCIPYEGNERLLNTTYDCDEFYKTWK